MRSYYKLVDEWKQEELDRTLEEFKQFLKDYDEELEKDAQRCDRHNNARCIASKELGLYDKDKLTSEEDEKVEIRAREIRKECNRDYEEFVKFKNNNSYYYKIQDKIMYRYTLRREGMEKVLEKATEVFKKDIDKHFETLQAKVEKKIGEINMIYHIGGDDYRFEGENGNCSVRVILAGGYNIQRLHTRWIIMK